MLSKCIYEKEINYNKKLKKNRIKVEKEIAKLEKRYNYNYQFSYNPILYLQSLFIIFI